MSTARGTSATSNGFWESELGRLAYFRGERENPRAGDPTVVFAQSAYREVMDHLRSDTSRELGGLLLGRFDRQRTTVHVQKALPAKHIHSNAVSLTFEEESWAEFDRQEQALQAEGFDCQRVGWYHSHPRISIFLSQHDLDVCQSFRQPHQVALVVDPVGRKGGFFPHGTAGYRDYDPQGFWEYRNEEDESSLDWKDVELDRDAIPPVAAVVSVDEPLPRKIKIGAKRPQPQPPLDATGREPESYQTLAPEGPFWTPGRRVAAAGFTAGLFVGYWLGRRRH